MMKAHTPKKAHPLKRERGQGLVEMVLVLPFLLVLVVGIVEAGVALNRQLTVVNAAREGARFGAFGATPADIHTQTLLATSQMFEFTEENAVVVVIQATTNEDGDDFEEWTENIYPADVTVSRAISRLHATQGEVLAELQEGIAPGDWPDKVGNVKLVVVDVRYDHLSMLGLPLVGALADQIPIGSWTAMRLTAPRVGLSGCCALPIALDTQTVNWPGGLDLGTEMDDIGVGDGPGRFGWLFWDPDNNGNAVNLEANLRNRCNAWQEFKDACDGDTTLTPDSWISGDSDQSVPPGVMDALEDLQKEGRWVSVPIWDQFEACDDMLPECDCRLGEQLVAHIVGFALVEITDVSLTGSPETISAKFHGFYNGCGE